MSVATPPPQADAAPEGPVRPPAAHADIRADLMPVEVLRARGNRRARRIAGMSLLLALLAVAVLYVVVRVQTSTARDDLAQADQRASTLIAGQSQYSELTATQGQISFVERRLAQLMAGDVRWASFLAAIASAAPSGVGITGIDATIDQPRVAGPSAADRIGTVSFTGTAPTAVEVSAFMDALSRLPGLAGVYLSSVGVSAPQTGFTITAVITSAAVASRYAQPAPATTTGGTR